MDNIVKNWAILNNKGLNAVSCCNCEAVIYHKKGTTMLKCNNCSAFDDISAFGDLYYNKQDFNFIFGGSK